MNAKGLGRAFVAFTGVAVITSACGGGMESSTLAGEVPAQRDAVIVFESTRDRNAEIYVMDADGSGVTNLTNHPASDVTPACSPDGKQIAWVTDREGKFQIYVMDADGFRSDQRHAEFCGGVSVPPGPPTASASPSCRTATATPRSTSSTPTARC